MTPLLKFLTRMRPKERAKAGRALTGMLGPLQRHQVIEQRIAAGDKLTDLRKEGKVLMSDDGTYFDKKALTKHGLDYAAYLLPRGES